MNEAIHHLILKLLAVLLAVFGLWYLIDGLATGGAFARIWAVVAGLFVIWTAVGFWRLRGWAFLLVSVALLVAFPVCLVRLLVAVDTGEGVQGRALFLVATIVLIGYLGRWGMERRFRPHLDAGTSH